MKQEITKDELRWCIRQNNCKSCLKYKECTNQKIIREKIKDEFIHIDLEEVLKWRRDKLNKHR